ncbi:hypothetical protein EXIGLDRAFT_841251, partial [Exidia glandulosa HHB12029]
PNLVLQLERSDEVRPLLRFHHHRRCSGRGDSSPERIPLQRGYHPRGRNLRRGRG